jgi:hypothetical protein
VLGPAVSAAALAAGLAGAATAAPPVGVCPKSFPEQPSPQQVFERWGPDFLAAFPRVDKNQDQIVCFKPLHPASGPGNFIDNTAAPHQ